MWKLELEDYFFKVYDKRKQLAAYFDPDYGQVGSEDELEKIRRLIGAGGTVGRGFLTVPMIKFEIFDEKSMQISDLEEKTGIVGERERLWRRFLEGFDGGHTITVSHTDPDMLSITLEVLLAGRVPLEAKALSEAISPILDQLQQQGLL